MKLSHLKSLIKEELKTLKEHNPPHNINTHTHTPHQICHTCPPAPWIIANITCPPGYMPMKAGAGFAPMNQSFTSNNTIGWHISGPSQNNTSNPQYGDECFVCMPMVPPKDPTEPPNPLLNPIGPEDPRGVSYRDPQSHKRK